MPKQHNECIVPKHCSIDIHACKCKFIYIILYFTLKGYKHVCMYVLCHSHQTQMLTGKPALIHTSNQTLDFCFIASRNI